MTGEKIKSLVFQPLSHSEKITDSDSNKDIRLFHLDFTATIELPSGEEELVIIELEKANISSDIFRYKRYIAHNFQYKQKKEIISPITKKLIEKDFPVRLLPIFILNFTIEDEVRDLMIKVNSEKIGVFKDKDPENYNEFIEHISYNMYIIQLPNINNIDDEEYKNDDYKYKLYCLLKLFDQQLRMTDTGHRLRVFKALFPDYLERIINRLKSADFHNPDLEDQMNAEDEYLQELKERDNLIAFLKQANEEAKLREEEAKFRLAKKMLEYGESVKNIMEETGLSLDKIEKLRKE